MKSALPGAINFKPIQKIAPKLPDSDWYTWAHVIFTSLAFSYIMEVLFVRCSFYEKLYLVLY